MKTEQEGKKGKAGGHNMKDFRAADNPLNEIHRTIAIISGKGGVGKSLVTGLLATHLQRTGRYRVGILDADITGPSVPRMFGADGTRPESTGAGMIPVSTATGIQLMSVNLLLDKPDSPVIWRGPMLANTVKHFWSDVIWGDVDFLFLDMPPGTGDVPLTVFQSIPLDGVVIVTSPQDLVSMIVKKAANMVRMMDIPILGLIENMSHVVCPHCGERIPMFGESIVREIALEWGIPYLGSLPVDPELARLCDEGGIEKAGKEYLKEAIQMLEKVPARRNPESKNAGEYRKIAIATEGKAVCEHFGHCEGFTIYTTNGGRVLTQEFLPNPGHKTGLLPNLLNENGVRAVIAGGMGGGAIEIFHEKGIEVITGAKGQLDRAIQEYLAGRLLSSGSVCHEHQHSVECHGG